MGCTLLVNTSSSISGASWEMYQSSLASTASTTYMTEGTACA